VLLHFRESGFLMSLLAAWMLLIFPKTTLAAASTPIEVIQSGTDKVLTILRQSEPGQPYPLRQREGEILDIVSNYFNFDEMSRRALGKPWKQQSIENRQEFAKLFKKLLFNTYVDRMENYNNEKIFYDSQKVENDFALVKTYFIHQNENIPIDYRLRKEEGRWQVYDVLVGGISYIDNYRSQFASILANQSFDFLLGMLRQKVERSG
jgi:phospholipid transport system substrate-binding protein